MIRSLQSIYLDSAKHMEVEKFNQLKKTLTIRKMEIIVTLAETHSVTLTAQEFSESNPSISLMLTRLEEASGIEIFSKRGQSFTLSEDGVALVMMFKEMLRVIPDFDAKPDS